MMLGQVDGVVLCFYVHCRIRPIRMFYGLTEVEFFYQLMFHMYDDYVDGEHCTGAACKVLKVSRHATHIVVHSMRLRGMQGLQLLTYHPYFETHFSAITPVSQENVTIRKP